MDAAISPAHLAATLLERPDGSERPLVIDVRRTPAYAEAADMIQGALRRNPEEIAVRAKTLPAAARVVVYCVHGYQVSQGAAQTLRECGIRAQFLDHGIEGWREQGGTLSAKPISASTRWVTRERPKIDRIACPWLIARFIDHDAEFLYVPAPDVRKVAAEHTAVPYDIADAEFGHDGPRCSFDAFIERYRLGDDPALAQLATHRPRSGYRVPGPGAAGPRVAGRVAWTVAPVQRRSRDARAWDGALRRLLPLVQRGPGRGSHLESEPLSLKTWDENPYHDRCRDFDRAGQ